MKVVLICSLLAVLALAKPRDVKKVRSVKHVSGGHDTEIFNKLMLVAKDANVRYSYIYVANTTKEIRMMTREASDKHNLHLEPEIEELENRILEINDDDPRGRSYNLVLAQAKKILDKLSASLSDDEVFPFIMEYEVLDSLAKNPINKRRVDNLKKLGLNLSDLVRRLSQYPVNFGHKMLDHYSIIKDLLDLLSKPSLSKMELKALAIRLELLKTIGKGTPSGKRH